MNFSSFLAKKYYFSKSRKSFVNKISILAIVIIALMVIAEIVVLSVFNGFTDQLKNIHSSFDSDLEIKPLNGKILEVSLSQKKAMNAIKDINVLTEILEDDAILDYKGSQDVIRFKGVDTNFFGQNQIKKHIEVGSVDLFAKPDISTAVIGVGIEYKFSINMKNPGFFMLMYPNRQKSHLKKSINSYQQLMAQPVGVFRIEMEYDERYLILPIASARQLTGYENASTAVEIKLKPKANEAQVRKELQSILGNKIQIQDREERHASIYKAIKIEKMMTYLIFTLILFIASLNLYAAVSMLVLSKQKDIETLNTMGASAWSIQKIFLVEGIYIILTGISIGGVLAFALVFLQDKVGLVSVPEPNILTSHIPVRMSVSDFVSSIALTLIVSLLMITKPVISSTNKISV